MRKDSSTPSRSPTSAANRVISPWISNAARHARTAWSSNATGAPNTAMTPSPVNLSTVPPYRCTTTAARLTRSAMISRSRSAPTAAAMSIECTTSANSTVTCLYSADRVACVSGAPHSLQNLEFGWQLGAARPTEQPRRGQSTATIPAGVHVSIVSPLVNDVRHIAVPSPTRSFETLVCRLIRDNRRADWTNLHQVPPQLQDRAGRWVNGDS